MTTKAPVGAPISSQLGCIIPLALAFVFVAGVEVSASCVAGQFCSGSASPVSIFTGGSYVIGCNYGYAGNGIIPLPGSGSCKYKDFVGTTAMFDCVAGTTPGTYSNSCALDSGSLYPPKENVINSITVTCAPGTFCGGSASPTSRDIGQSYTISCNYGYVGNGIEALPGSGSCAFSSFSGDAATFKCIAGNIPGTYGNSCGLNSGSPYAPRTDAINTLTIQSGSSTFPVTIPNGATAFLSLEQKTGWTADASSSISPNPPALYAINPTGGGGATMTLETRGTSGKYTGWMAKKVITIPSGDLHMLARASYNFSSVSGIQAWEVGRRATNAAKITDNGQTQLVPISGGQLEFDIVPSASGGWKDTGCRFPTFVAGKTYNEELYYTDDTNGALSLEYVSLNGTLCAIPSNLQHIAGASAGWAPNSAVMAFQPDANPTAVAYNAIITMNVWTW
jgi:hypothetical protein